MKIVDKKATGFTLIELLIVISIIAVLAAMLFTNFSGARERTRDLQRKSDLDQLKKALRLYYNDYQRYPVDDGSGRIQGCGADQANPSVCAWGSTFSAGAGPTIYMNQLPADPVATTSYTYTRIDDDQFTIQATLENLSDDAASKSQVKCGVNLANVVAKVYMVCND